MAAHPQSSYVKRTRVKKDIELPTWKKAHAQEIAAKKAEYEASKLRVKLNVNAAAAGGGRSALQPLAPNASAGDGAGCQGTTRTFGLTGGSVAMAQRRWS